MPPTSFGRVVGSPRRPAVRHGQLLLDRRRPPHEHGAATASTTTATPSPLAQRPRSTPWIHSAPRPLRRPAVADVGRSVQRDPVPAASGPGGASGRSWRSCHERRRPRPRRTGPSPAATPERARTRSSRTSAARDGGADPPTVPVVDSTSITTNPPHHRATDATLEGGRSAGCRRYRRRGRRRSNSCGARDPVGAAAASRTGPAATLSGSEQALGELSTPVGLRGIVVVEELEQVDELLAGVIVALHPVEQRSQPGVDVEHRLGPHPRPELRHDVWPGSRGSSPAVPGPRRPDPRRRGVRRGR